MKTAYLLVPFAPLAGAIIAGLFGRAVGRTGSHVATILGVLVSLIASVTVAARRARRQRPSTGRSTPGRSSMAFSSRSDS